MDYLRHFIEKTASVPAARQGPPGGRCHFHVGRKGTKNGMFQDPTGVVCTKEGNIVVVDTENHRVQVFTPEGAFLNTFGVSGPTNNRLKFPMCVALTWDEPEKVMVTDSVNARVKIFTQDGVFVAEIGDENLFAYPSGLATLSNQSLVVSDVCKHCVIVLDLDGNVLSRFGRYGASPNHLDHPYFLCTNNQDHIIVSDSGNAAIKIFSAAGQLLRIHNSSDFKIFQEVYVVLQGLSTDEDDNLLVIGNSTVYVMANNGRLWEVLVPDDGLDNPVCVCSTGSGKLAVTQRGEMTSQYGVGVYSYNKDVFRPLKSVPPTTTRQTNRSKQPIGVAKGLR